MHLASSITVLFNAPHAEVASLFALKQPIEDCSPPIWGACFREFDSPGVTLSYTVDEPSRLVWVKVGFRQARDEAESLHAKILGADSARTEICKQVADRLLERMGFEVKMGCDLGVFDSLKADRVFRWINASDHSRSTEIRAAFDGRYWWQFFFGIAGLDQVEIVDVARLESERLRQQIVVPQRLSTADEVSNLFLSSYQLQ